MLSVVIPTYDRPQCLEKTLKALGNQLKWLKEAVVVDDGGPVGADLETIVSVFPWARYVYMEPQTTDWRAGMARNCGARLTSGERILFLDDDCAPRPGALRVHDSYGPSPIVVASRIDMVAEDNMGLRRDKRFLHGHYINVAKSLKLKTHFETVAYGAFWSGHMSVPAKEFKEVGGFWEQIQSYGGEDQEIAWRLKEYGCKLKIDFRAVAYHFGKQHVQNKLNRQISLIEASGQEPGLIREGVFLPPPPPAPPGSLPIRGFYNQE